jgi:regulator of protease activity HflC (stomatin/prohibitin superfamily)
MSLTITEFAWTVAIAAAILLLLFASLRIAQQYERAIVFRLGRYHRSVGPGLFWIIPLVETQTTVDLRTTTYGVEEQETITRDNVPIKINAVIWSRVVDPARSLIEVRGVANSVVQVAVTALRNVIGRHTLDAVLKDQESVGQALQETIDRVTEPWGVKVERVEMKNVEIPASMQRAMAQEAEALREKRARQIKAEAEKDAATLLNEASTIIMQSPAGLELRRMQMITEVGAEQNTMTIIMMPSEFVNMARAFADRAKPAA